MLAGIALLGVLLATLMAQVRDRQRRERVHRAAMPRIGTARAAYQHALNLSRLGETNPLELCLWSRRWCEAELESAGTKAGRLAAARAHLVRVNAANRSAQEGIASGELVGREFDYYIAEAEFWIARADAD